MPLLVSDESANLGGKELIGSKSGLGEPGEAVEEVDTKDSLEAQELDLEILSLWPLLLEHVSLEGGLLCRGALFLFLWESFVPLLARDESASLEQSSSAGGFPPDRLPNDSALAALVKLSKVLDTALTLVRGILV